MSKAILATILRLIREDSRSTTQPKHTLSRTNGPISLKYATPFKTNIKSFTLKMTHLSEASSSKD